ncbi:uncharacterized protein N7479_000637 [Penicillium vulpinum]|uniref:uncharacterized protein n=1 Tax=Penicillium vulpinum TaxID=29845 RepID=UPI002548DEB7|nr:uncharacterized protein N7479_000637 [Penicillium vulpinum]KAJ5970719.1 hypothetical protein N7479_000637 [Penicillium vulpinum]
MTNSGGAIPAEIVEPSDIEIDENEGRIIVPDTGHRIDFGERNAGLQVGVNYGNITTTFAPSQTNVALSQTIFGNLFIQDYQKVELHLTSNTLLKKARLQTGRRNAINNRSYYEPYVAVKNRAIKRRLIFLAGRFSFLDCGFAEYFQSVVPSFDQDYVQQRLKEIRQVISRGQISNPSNVGDSEIFYVGDLGEFCEAVSKTWSHDSDQAGAGTPKFIPTHRRDQEIFEYLQDAFETGYWELMLDIFLQWRKISKSLSGDVVLKVLDSLEREIRTARSQLLDEIEAQSEASIDDLAPILEGIDARIAVLSTVGDLNEPPVPEMQEENVGLIALILLFLIAAIVPGYKAFSISMKSKAPGSVQDADFWYLIQSSIMSVLGNLTMVIPLMKKSWFSPAYNTMWIFFFLGVTFAIISIVIYPFLNTGWSSMLAFFGSIASAASVLVMTQAAARNVPGKIKED